MKTNRPTPWATASSSRSQRAGDVDVDEGLAVVAFDVGFVQGAGMDHRLDGVVADDLADQGAVGDRSDHRGLGRRNDVQPRHRVAGGAQGRPRVRPSQPEDPVNNTRMVSLRSRDRLIASPVGAANA